MSKEQCTLERRLERLSRETGHQVMTRHGQRIFGGPPPGWTEDREPRGTEVYCYRLPRDCFEDELVPVFSSAGRIFELRMMLEFSGANRGYCYVRYCTIEGAEKAVKSLNNHQIRPGHRLAVTKSVDNQKLCVKTVPAIPLGIRQEEVLTELNKLLDGVVRVRNLNKNWLEVEFESHRKAALARRKLVPGNLTMFQRLAIREVDWADPHAEEKNRIIEVWNLPQMIPMQRVHRMFDQLSGGQVQNIVMNPNDNWALVTFISHTAASAVMETGNYLEVGGQRINLSWRGRAEEDGARAVERQHRSLREGWGVPAVPPVHGVPAVPAVSAVWGLGPQYYSEPRQMLRFSVPVTVQLQEAQQYLSAPPPPPPLMYQASPPPPPLMYQASALTCLQAPVNTFHYHGV